MTKNSIFQPKFLITKLYVRYFPLFHDYLRSGMRRHLFVCAGATIHSVAILHYLFVPTLLKRHGVSLQALVDSELIVSPVNLTGAAGEHGQSVTLSPIEAHVSRAIEAALECDPVDRALVGQYALFARALCSIPIGLPLCTLAF